MSSQHPGKILLQQYLAPQNISQNKLARAINVPPRRINEIVHEKRAVTADTAVRLAIYFGNSASYWMHLQASFDIDRIKNTIDNQLRMMPVSPIGSDSLAADRKTDTDTAKLQAIKTHSVKTRIMR